MKKYLKNRLLISGILCLLLAAILIIVETEFNLTLFLCNLTSEGWASIFLISAIILFEILMIKALSSLKKRIGRIRVMLTITSVCCAIILFFIALCNFIFSGEPKYFVFFSPDKQHSIVVEEESFLLSGYGNIYEKANHVVLKYDDTYFTDDGYRPFSDNNYKLDWKKDSVTITYGFGEIDEYGNEIKRKVKIYFITTN